MFDNNVALIDETKQRVNAKLELWRDILESNDLMIS